jgi:HD-GYP domain-containing protein (c-di-GMP phosphodiesterase class II)
MERSLGKAGSETREVLLEGALVLLALMEEKDPYLRQHAERVANNCVRFCEKFGLLPPKEFDSLYFASLLHDLGLVLVPDEILRRAPEELAAEERRVFENHPVSGERILSHLSILKSTLPLVRSHHEKFDGSGYPDRKKGGEIPLGARLLHLCDGFDRLVFPRGGGAGRSVSEALEEIIALSGSEFDEALVDQFAQFAEASGGVSPEYFRIPKRKEEPASVFKEIFAQILQRFASGRISPPVMPRVVQELEIAVKLPNATAESLAAVIEKDAVVSLRLISMANSPVYRGQKEIRTVREAIPRMGLRETANVVTAIANKGLYESQIVTYRLLLDKMWSHSLAAAHAARLIGQRLGRDDADTLFLMGLTHDIGKVFLLRAFADESQVRGMDMKLLLAAVQDAHIGIGTLMLRRWGFNEAFLRAVALHDKPELAADAPAEGRIVHLANALSRSLGFRVGDRAPDGAAEPPAAEALGLPPEALGEMGEQVKTLVKELAHLY